MPTSPLKKGKIIVFGILFWYPLAGVTFQFLHYLLGLRRLGYDPYYIEDSGRWIYDPQLNDLSPDASGNIAAVVPTLEAHGFGNRWAFRGNYPGRQMLRHDRGANPATLPGPRCLPQRHRSAGAARRAHGLPAPHLCRDRPRWLPRSRWRRATRPPLPPWRRTRGLAEVFEEAARALGELERESLGPTGEMVTGTLRVESPDLPALLVDWLNELIYWCEAERAVPDQVVVRLGDGALPSGRPADQPPRRPADSPPGRLAAQVHGPRLSHRPALVKAATHHGLRLEQTAEGWEAEVVLDV